MQDANMGLHQRTSVVDIVTAFRVGRSFQFGYSNDLTAFFLPFSFLQTDPFHQGHNTAFIGRFFARLWCLIEGRDGEKNGSACHQSQGKPEGKNTLLPFQQDALVQSQSRLANAMLSITAHMLRKTEHRLP